jgi:hypothetical protein
MLTRLAGALALACCSLCLFEPAIAGEVFDGLGPELIGTELTAVLEGAELACRQDPVEKAIRRCHPLPGALNSLEGAPAAVEAVFVDERLAQVAVTLPERRFAKVRRAVLTKLGEGQDWTVSIRGGMNAGFKNEIVIWERDKWTAVLQQFDHKIDRSSLTFGSPSAMASLLRQIKSTPPGGSRDL